jgi:hypothetical protein
MSPVSIAKLVLAVAGIGVFLLGVRLGIPMLRWTGTALVVIAWLLRFADRAGPRTDSRPATTNDPPEDP